MLPGWDSLESAAAYAKWFTYAGFAALFLLGVCEILAHVYSTREKTLLMARENAEELRRQNDARDANKRVRDAEAHVASAKAVADKAEHDLSKLQEKLADRTLTNGQVKAIKDSVAPFAGQRFEAITYPDNPEAVNLTEQIAS